MVRIVAFADFGPIYKSEAGEKNGSEKVECGNNRVEWPKSEVRNDQHERCTMGEILFAHSHVEPLVEPGQHAE